VRTEPAPASADASPRPVTTGTAAAAEPHLPADEGMTDAELKTIREYLGLTGGWLSASLGVSARQGRKWEEGAAPIPDGVRQEIEAIQQRTAEAESWLIATLMNQHEPIAYVYRTDEDLAVANMDFGGFPASWWRAVVARVAQEMPGLPIRYPEPRDTNEYSNREDIMHTIPQEEPGEGSRIYRLVVLKSGRKAASSPLVRQGGLWVDQTGKKSPQKWAEIVGQEGLIAEYLRTGEVTEVQIIPIDDDHAYPFLTAEAAEKTRDLKAE
jgi:DNA-binding transcriptional regulator YiaG